MSEVTFYSNRVHIVPPYTGGAVGEPPHQLTLRNGIFVMINIKENIVDIYSKEQLAQAYYTEAELIRNYGRNSLAFFGLSPENLHFLAPDGAGLVNYRLVSNVAVVLGDPVCAQKAFEKVKQSFLVFWDFKIWRGAFFQPSPTTLPPTLTPNFLPST